MRRCTHSCASAASSRHRGSSSTNRSGRTMAGLQQADRDGLGQPVGDEQVRRGPAVADDLCQQISRPLRRRSRSAPENGRLPQADPEPGQRQGPAGHERPAGEVRPIGRPFDRRYPDRWTDARLRRCAAGPDALRTPGRQGRTRRHRVPGLRPGPELSGRRDPGILPRRHGDGRSIGLRLPGPAAPARPGPAG